MSKEQEILIFVHDHPDCTYDDINTALRIPRSTLNNKIIWLVASGQVERFKVGRFWHFRVTEEKGAKIVPLIKGFRDGVELMRRHLENKRRS